LCYITQRVVSEKEKKVNFFICGFTGAGKTTFLKKLSVSEHLKIKEFELLDLDQVILENFSDYKSLADLIADKGFSEFRKIELKSIMKISLHGPTILALGGGSLRNDTIEALKDWQGLWLNETFETCYSRICGDKSRPIADLPKNELEKLYLERTSFYSRYKEIKTIGQVIEIICK
jgi:shikimate kinase